MSVTVITFFNNRGGVGKTSLVYHLAWILTDLGTRVVAVDLDPQANLTAAFLEEDRLEELWPEGDHPDTIYGCVQPIIKGIGDVSPPHLEDVANRLALLVGDLALSGFEDQLSDVWPSCLDRDERAFRVTSAFWRTMQTAADQHQADVVLMDLGPNLGAINRAALISADFVVIPLSPDLFSVQGLRNLGPSLRKWREEWKERLGKNPAPDLKLPPGTMQPAGYIVQQHSVRLDRPVKAYDRWIARIPHIYRDEVLQISTETDVSLRDDPECLALLKHYRSLAPMAQEAKKPVFHLKPADGAIGAHFNAVKAAYQDFEKMAQHICKKTGLKLRQELHLDSP